MSRTRTIRGTIPSGLQTLYNTGQPVSKPLRLLLDNSDFRDDYIVTEFKIYPNMDNTEPGVYNDGPNNNDVTYVTLSLNEEAGHQKGEFSNGSQIGWVTAHSETVTSNIITHLDTNHLVVQDLWIGYYAVDVAVGSTGVLSVPLNYTITLQPKKVSAAEGVMGLIKEASQGAI